MVATLSKKLSRLEQAARRTAASRLVAMDKFDSSNRLFMRQFCPHFHELLHAIHDDATGNVVLVYTTITAAMRVCCMEMYTGEGHWRLRWDKEV